MESYSVDYSVEYKQQSLYDQPKMEPNILDYSSLNEQCSPIMQVPPSRAPEIQPTSDMEHWSLSQSQFADSSNNNSVFDVSSSDLLKSRAHRVFLTLCLLA
jgi:hypothetical protein